MTAFTFDARTVTPDEGRTGAIPAGWYPVMADEAELKPTADANGNMYINLRCAVLDGPHKGAKIWHRFNVKNHNDKAVEIAQKQLSALCHAINVLVVQNLNQLLNIPFFVKLKRVEADGQYDAKNEITAFRPINDEAAKAGYKAGPEAPSAAKPASRPAAAAPSAPSAPGAAAAAWGNSQPPAQQPVQPPAQAPAQAAQAAQAAQPWQQPANAAPAAATSAAPAAQAQTAPAAEQPAWASAPSPAAQTMAAPAQSTAPAASPEAPAAQQGGDELPPWMR